MSYTVTLASDGTCFEAAAEEYILDAALRAGRRFPFGCRSGTCGSCRGRVLEGEVRYPEGRPPALDAAEEAAGGALFCRARAASDLRIEVRELGGSGEIVVRTLPARVMRLERLAPEVMGLWLQLPSTERFEFLAGQYVEVLTRDGTARAFSLANAPGAGDLLELHVRRYPGGVFSGHVFTEMKERALIRIRGPLGGFHLREDSDRPMIMVAGGTGFAPVKGIIEHALATGVTRPIRLYRGVRTVEDLYMPGLAPAWCRAHPQVDYVPVVTEPDAQWSGRSGFVHLAVQADQPAASGLDAYVCGPPPMVRAVREVLLGCGLEPGRFYCDSFEPASPAPNAPSS